MSHVTVEAAGLLFDMDGVLVSSIGSVIRSWRRWAEHFGVPGAEDLEVPHGIPARDIIARLKPDLAIAEGLRYIEDLEIEDVRDLKVLPGVRELLGSLPLERWAIVTSATHRLLLGRLQAAGLPVPERLISADMVVNGKPHPEPYMRGAELIHAAPQDCVVLEDAPSGVRAGKAAGCRVLAVLGTHVAEELSATGADWVVASLVDVKANVMAAGVRLEFEAL